MTHVSVKWIWHIWQLSLSVTKECDTLVWHKSLTHWCDTIVCHNSVTQQCHTLVWHNIVTQCYDPIVWHKIVTQYYDPLMCLYSLVQRQMLLLQRVWVLQVLVRAETSSCRQLRASSPNLNSQWRKQAEKRVKNRRKPFYYFSLV